MIEEHENQETSLQDLIDLVERDNLPTNEFTIEDKDPMVILGKLNEVIAYLQTLQATINASDSKANEALQQAIQAVTNAIEAISTANTALSASNTALSTANTAISTANTALSSANSAVETASNAVSTANSANTTANEAKSTAQEALDQVVAGLGTKVYRDTQLLNSLDIKPIEDDIADNTTSITALQNGKVDKVTGKQLSTEDFTTAEKTKLAGLNNYDDTQVQADLSSLNSNKADKNNANQSIVAGSVTAPTGNFSNINESLQSVNNNITNLSNQVKNDFVKQGLADINTCSDYEQLYTTLSNSPNGTGVGDIGYASQEAIRSLLPSIPFPANFVDVYAKIIAGNDINAWVIELSTIDLYSNGQTIPTYKLQIGKNIVDNTATYRVSKWYSPAGKYEEQKGIVTWSASRSHTQTITFPEAFSSVPSVVCTAIGVDRSHTSNICGLIEVTTTGFKFAVYGFGSNDKSIGAHWVAIGE